MERPNADTAAAEASCGQKFDPTKPDTVDSLCKSSVPGPVRGLAATVAVQAVGCQRRQAFWWLISMDLLHLFGVVLKVWHPHSRSRVL